MKSVTCDDFGIGTWVPWPGCDVIDAEVASGRLLQLDLNPACFCSIDRARPALSDVADPFPIPTVGCRHEIPLLTERYCTNGP